MFALRGRVRGKKGWKGDLKKFWGVIDTFTVLNVIMGLHVCTYVKTCPLYVLCGLLYQSCLNKAGFFKTKPTMICT